MKKLYFVAAAFLMAALPAAAQQTPAPPPPPPLEGQTVLNVAATEHDRVEQDMLTASLSIQKEGNDPAALQNEINGLMQQAMAKAKAVPGVEASTGQYFVYPYDEQAEDGKPSKAPRRWRGSQELNLQGREAAPILALAGVLQQMGLTIGQLTYVLSPEKAESAQEALMERALAKVKSKAERAAKALGKTKMELVEVSVDSSNASPPPYPVMMRASMAADKAYVPPTAEAGMAEVELTVSARALLKP